MLCLEEFRGEKTWIQYFTTKEEAVQRRDSWHMDRYGEFAVPD